MSALLTIRETAKRFGVHENTIRNWMAAGTLPHITLPSGVRRVPEVECERLVAGMTGHGECECRARYVPDRDGTLPAVAACPRSRECAAALRDPRRGR